jgi:hypothetical protein
MEGLYHEWGREDFINDIYGESRGIGWVVWTGLIWFG